METPNEPRAVDTFALLAAGCYLLLSIKADVLTQSQLACTGFFGVVAVLTVYYAIARSLRSRLHFGYMIVSFSMVVLAEIITLCFCWQAMADV